MIEHVIPTTSARCRTYQGQVFIRCVDLQNWILEVAFANPQYARLLRRMVSIIDDVERQQKAKS